MELSFQSQQIVSQSVTSLSEASLACNLVKEVTNKLNFDKVTREQILIAAKELTSNLAVHNTIDGKLSVYEIERQNKSGIALVSSDKGPGIKSVSAALADNSSSIGTMGCGLGAVRRLMDEFDINSILVEQQQDHQHITHAVGGTVIVATKWQANSSESINGFYWGGVSRPMPGYSQNGDAYFLNETDETIDAVVVDGLGHGELAQVASDKVISVAQKHTHLPFDQLFPMMHEEARGTRGAAVTAVHINKKRRNIVHCGVGNVETRLFPNPLNSPIARSGVIGSGRLPKLMIREFPWEINNMLVISTDGISNRWGDSKHIIQKISHNPLMVSHYLLRDYGRVNDDATALVIKEGRAHVS